MDYSKFIPEIFRWNNEPHSIGMTAGEGNKLSILKIELVNGQSISYHTESDVVGDPADAWRDFYDWYINNTSDTFIMRYTTGLRMFRRVDIRSFVCYTTENRRK